MSSRFDPPALVRMREVAEAIKVESKKPKPDDARLTKLRGEFEAASTEMELLREKQRANILARVDENGNPVKSERGHTPRDLDDDPWGEPRSIWQPSVFSDPWGIFGTDHDTRSASPSEWRSRALSAVERLSGANDSSRSAMTNIIERWDDDESSQAKLLVATSDPSYMAAFREAALRPSAPIFSQQEVESVRRVNRLSRAMGLTDSAGGFLVPFQLDPSVIISSDGSTNPIRRIARQVIATGDSWHGVSSTGVGWSWDAEAEEVSDDATTYSQPTIPIHAARGFVPISFEAMADAANVAQEVGRQLAFGKDTLESAAFTTGSGSGEPTGIVQAIAIDSGSSVVAATTDNAFGSVDVYKVDEALPARFRANGSWLAHRVIQNDVGAFESTAGMPLFPSVYGAPGTLLGRPILEASDLDSTYPSGNNYVLVFGDFSHYVVADRIGTTVEFVPHLFGTNHRPTGARGWFAYFRAGADSVLDGAFRILNV